MVSAMLFLVSIFFGGFAFSLKNPFSWNSSPPVAPVTSFVGEFTPFHPTFEAFALQGVLVGLAFFYAAALLWTFSRFRSVPPGQGLLLALVALFLLVQLVVLVSLAVSYRGTLDRVARGREQKHNETVALLEMCAKLKKETAECKRAKADESKFIGEPNYLSVLLFSFSEGLELYFHHMSQITGEAKAIQMNALMDNLSWRGALGVLGKNVSGLVLEVTALVSLAYLLAAALPTTIGAIAWACCRPRRASCHTGVMLPADRGAVAQLAGRQGSLALPDASSADTETHSVGSRALVPIGDAAAATVTSNVTLSASVPYHRGSPTVQIVTGTQGAQILVFPMASPPETRSVSVETGLSLTRQEGEAIGACIKQAGMCRLLTDAPSALPHVSRNDENELPSIGLSRRQRRKRSDKRRNGNLDDNAPVSVPVAEGSNEDAPERSSLPLSSSLPTPPQSNWSMQSMDDCS